MDVPHQWYPIISTKNPVNYETAPTEENIVNDTNDSIIDVNANVEEHTSCCDAIYLTMYVLLITFVAMLIISLVGIGIYFLMSVFI